MATKPSNLKITAVGDGYVGKTCMLITYTTGKFPAPYVPTVFENYAATIKVDGQEHNVAIWDTAGQEDYERLRPLSYPNTSCFLLCYSVASSSSFQNIRQKWIPEIRHHMPNAPIVLVATKIDLRDDPTQPNLITTSEGKKLRDKIKAAKFIECSAQNKQGLDEIFQEAVKCSLNHKVVKRTPCTLL